MAGAMISQAAFALFAAGVRRVKCAMHPLQIAVALLLTASTQRDGKRRGAFYTAGIDRSATACKSLRTRRSIVAQSRAEAAS
jgi:hypothetical protein